MNRPVPWPIMLALMLAILALCCGVLRLAAISRMYDHAW